MSARDAFLQEGATDHGNAPVPVIDSVLIDLEYAAGINDCGATTSIEGSNDCSTEMNRCSVLQCGGRAIKTCHICGSSVCCSHYRKYDECSDGRTQQLYGCVDCMKQRRETLEQQRLEKWKQRQMAEQSEQPVLDLRHLKSKLQPQSSAQLRRRRHSRKKKQMLGMIICIGLFFFVLAANV